VHRLSNDSISVISSDSRALRSLLLGAGDTVAGPTNEVLTGAPTETPIGTLELNRLVMWALNLA
jgi:hypothetical protein